MRKPAKAVRHVHLDPLESRLLLSAAQLVKDINTSSPTSAPANYVSIGGTTYFTTDDGVRGTELWRTDGTPAGTRLVKDIEPGAGSSSPTNLTNVGGTLFFVATTSAGGAELWRSDGTEAGTAQVIDAVTGPASGVNAASGLAAVGGRALFARVNTGTSGGFHLWASDGTPAGTQSLTGTKRWATLQLDKTIAAGGWTYFGGLGTVAELWRTDGTAAGTTLVKSQSNVTVPVPLGNVGGQVLFTSTDSAAGNELWATDGTTGGTRLVKDVWPGTSSSSIKNTAVAGGRLFFQATEPAALTELWVSDGTTDGTRLVKDVSPKPSNSSNPDNLVAFGGLVYFKAVVGNQPGVWQSDGTDAGTVQVLTFPAATAIASVTLTVSRGVLYVDGPDNRAPGDVYKIAAPGGAPVLLRDELDAGPVFDVPQGTVFTGDDGGGPELWFTDGTTAGTRLVTPLRPGGEGNADPRQFARVGDRYLFFANDGLHGAELWVTDGTDVGTHLVKDINPGSANGVAQTLRGGVLNGVLYFGANDGAGYELWRSDGTAEGTRVFYEFRPGPTGLSFSMNNFTEYNGALYFNADNGVDTDFWRTDGTPAGTVRMSDVYAGVPRGLESRLRVVNGSLYFVNSTSSNSMPYLYRFNGTAVVPVVSSYVLDWGAAGATPIAFTDSFSSVRVVRVNPSGSSTQVTTITGSFEDVTGDAGGVVYFVHSTTAEGAELWATDGTLAGTHIVQDLANGFDSSWPANGFTYGGRFYFTARVGASHSVWVIDAPGVAPRKMVDVAPSGGATPVVSYVDYAGALHFQAAGKLWRITAAGGAEVVADDVPQPTNLGFVVLGGTLLFGVQDARTGSELYRYPALPDTRPPAVADAVFEDWAPLPRVTVSFDEYLATAPSAGDLTVEDLVTGWTFAATAVTYNPDTRTAVFTFAGGLPNGRYRASFAGGAVADAAGNASAAWSGLTFTALAGDANRDGVVNFDDLLALAKNYNATAATFVQGDLNGDGVVNFDDLLILAKNYNQAVTTAPASSMSTTTVVKAASTVAPVAKAPAAKPVPPPTPPRPAPRPKPAAPVRGRR